MLKNLVSTFIILLAAGLISLGWYVFSITAASQSVQPTIPPGITQTDEPASGQMPAGDTSKDLPAGPEGNEMGFSLTRTLTGMAANVGITALVIVLIVWLRKLADRIASIPFKLVWIKK
ncbi:MAG: hypothetical protein HYR94_28790 [Chloroflexi bacterium]|nr:hypothetical protein [Chloroflexota bacterium]